MKICSLYCIRGIHLSFITFVKVWMDLQIIKPGLTVLEPAVHALFIHTLPWENGSGSAMNNSLNSKNGGRFTEPVGKDMATRGDIWQRGGHTA